MKKIGRSLQKLFFKQRGERALEDAGLFLALFTLFFTIIYFVLNYFAGRALHYFAANAGAFFLKFLEITGEVVPNSQDGFPHLLGSVRGNAFDAQINDLCAGAIELSVLFAIVLASRDKAIKQRLLGIAGGFVVFAFFNPLRIVLTLNAVGTWALPLLHDVLFRVSLVIGIVGYYALWYYATPSTATRGQRR